MSKGGGWCGLFIFERLGDSWGGWLSQPENDKRNSFAF